MDRMVPSGREACCCGLTSGLHWLGAPHHSQWPPLLDYLKLVSKAFFKMSPLVIVLLSGEAAPVAFPAHGWWAALLDEAFQHRERARWGGTAVPCPAAPLPQPQVRGPLPSALELSLSSEPRSWHTCSIKGKTVNSSHFVGRTTSGSYLLCYCVDSSTDIMWTLFIKAGSWPDLVCGL